MLFSTLSVFGYSQMALVQLCLQDCPQQYWANYSAAMKEQAILNCELI
jgi:hypothetical protein